MFYCMQTKCVMLNQVLTEFAIFYIEQIVTNAVCKLSIDHSNSNAIFYDSLLQNPMFFFIDVNALFRIFLTMT